MAEQDTSVSYQFTKAGNNLSAKALAGTIKIDFTRAELSTTNHFGEAEADIAGLTELDGVTQTVDLKEVDVVDNDPSFVKIPVKIDETAAPEDYALLTIGLYCKPDDGDEVLYSICALKDPIYIHKSSTNSTFNLNLNTLVGSSSNVVIKVDPAGMVTHADFDAMMKRVAFIDKPNVFSERQTLAGGAVDGTGNAIATTKDVSDGDATTLKSAKEYADTQVSGKADDSKVVHTADMRKPASDVAGIEEVNAKQDKIGYTPADDSKVVHNSGLARIPTDNSGLVVGNNGDIGFFKQTGINGAIGVGSHNSFNVVQSNNSSIGMADTFHNMFRINGNYQISLGPGAYFTPADDSKVAHLSGANNFDTIPTVNNNPLLLASSLPSDLARTSQQTNFTDGLKKGGKDVATVDEVADAKQAAINQALTDAQWLIDKLPKHVTLTQAEFNAIATKDVNTYYYITG